MSVTSDIRSYADTAVAQGKQVIDQVIEQVIDQTIDKAQAQFGEISGKATGAAHDLRAQAEKAVDLDALTAAVEPYVVQVKEYTSAVADKVSASVETLLTVARKDPRFDRFVITAESFGAVLLVTVNERVVQPVVSLTAASLAGVAGKPTLSNGAAGKPAARRPGAGKPAAAEPATAKPTTPAAAGPTTRKPAAPKAASPARKAAATKPATRPATTSPARKTAARKTAGRRSTDS
jgi:hypothetical protein